MTQKSLLLKYETYPTKVILTLNLNLGLLQILSYRIFFVEILVCRFKFFLQCERTWLTNYPELYFKIESLSWLCTKARICSETSTIQKTFKIRKLH